MLDIRVAAGDALHVGADVLVVPVFKGGIDGPGATQVLDALGLDRFPVTPDFRGDVDQTLLLAATGLAAGGVLLVGLGRMDAVDDEHLRRAAGAAARACRGARVVATTLAEVHPTVAAVEAIAEGFHLGAYTDARWRSQPEPEGQLAEVVVLVPSSRLQECAPALARAAVRARATGLARDLVNAPPDRKRPPDLAVELTNRLEPACEVRVRDEEQLSAQGFGGLLAVGRGSSAPPRLVEARYRPDHPLGHVVLIGKGVTFDSGGLQKKSTDDMAEMKSDMAGAAAVAAACSALADLDVRLEVTALLPLAENMPGADAQRPDDVVRIYGGTTVEIRDTDAEGRLILADALAYGATLRPDAMVDLATLTGSAIRAIGRYAACIMGSDDDLTDALCRAARAAGEDVWPLPLWPHLERFLESSVADIDNVGQDVGGGAIVGGLFLKRFCGGVPWAHLDIAGPAWLPAELATGYLPPGATGFGVRTLLAWLERRAA